MSRSRSSAMRPPHIAEQPDLPIRQVAHPQLETAHVFVLGSLGIEPPEHMQTRPVQIIELLGRDTVDEMVEDVLAGKVSIIEAVINRKKETRS